MMHCVYRSLLVLASWSGLFFTAPALAQQANATEKTLSPEQVMQLVRQYNPIAKQAGIQVQQAKAKLLAARGGFDPVLSQRLAEKTFDGTAYYEYNNSELNIPTWFGIEVKAGMETLNGNRVNSSETTGTSNYIGISVPLGRDLLMDKRRALLQTARVMRDASYAEQQRLLNDLLLDAQKAYWNWYKSYQILFVLNEAVAVNEKRMAFVREAYRQGDRPALDTTEALAQLQQLQVQQQAAQLELRNNQLDLSVYLWTPEGNPYLLPDEVSPLLPGGEQLLEMQPLPVIDSLLNVARKNHPELLLYTFKLQSLSIEKRYRFQQLLPEADLQYNFLQEGNRFTNTLKAPLFDNNFQYGLKMSIPLRLSAERGNYRNTKLTINSVMLEQDLKITQIENKVKAYFNELVNLRSQVSLQTKAYANYYLLQRGEEIRFSIGESSLFLVNARENKRLEALQKLQELKAKLALAGYQLSWAVGQL
ncbi:MAG: TolC family protein [Sphingomonadales bacterium]|nr:TolC family protein [Sphingomonadales bacterium]